MGKYLFHVSPARNADSILAHGLIPRIGPRSKKAGEPGPAVYLFHDRDDMEDALDNWLGEEIGDEPVAIFLVKTDERVKPGLARQPDGFETTCILPIPPDLIRLVAIE